MTDFHFRSDDHQRKKRSSAMHAVGFDNAFEHGLYMFIRELSDKLICKLVIAILM
jgi:hypothetical protein